MNQLSPQMRRFAAVGLLVLVVLTVFFYGLVPLAQGYVDRANEVAILDKRLSSMRALIANQDLVDEELSRLESLNANGEIFLPGNKATIASAKLREFISDIVKTSGGSLVSTQEYQTLSLDTASAVGLRVQFNGQTNHLTSLLYQLESARPLLFVDEITVTSSAAQHNTQRSSRVSAWRSQSMTLTVKLDIFGYMITGEAPEKDTDART